MENENLIKQRMDKALISFQGDLNSIRVGRASLNMLDPISVDVVWTNVIERDGDVHSAGIEYSIEDKTGNLVWDKKSQKQYEGVTKAETGGLITELVMGSFNADSKIMNQMVDVKNDGERSVEYFTPLMTFLTAMDYIVMCSQYGDEFLQSLGITDTEFRTMDEYLKEMEEE